MPFLKAERQEKLISAKRRSCYLQTAILLIVNYLIVNLYSPTPDSSNSFSVSFKFTR